jgi:hypothetical protein
MRSLTDGELTAGGIFACVAALVLGGVFFRLSFQEENEAATRATAEIRAADAKARAEAVAALAAEGYEADEIARVLDHWGGPLGDRKAAFVRELYTYTIHQPHSTSADKASQSVTRLVEACYGK